MSYQFSNQNFPKNNTLKLKTQKQVKLEKTSNVPKIKCRKRRDHRFSITQKTFLNPKNNTSQYSSSTDNSSNRKVKTLLVGFIRIGKDIHPNFDLIHNEKSDSFQLKISFPRNPFDTMETKASRDFPLEEVDIFLEIIPPTDPIEPD